MNPQSFPPEAVLAHGLLHAYEVQGGVLYQNTDLLYHAVVLNARLDFLDTLIGDFYGLATEETDGYRPSIFRTPTNAALFEHIASIAQAVAYSTSPQDVGNAFTTALGSPSQRAAHIGSSTVRFHGFLRFLTEKHLPADHLDHTHAALRLFCSQEANSIHNAIKIAALSELPPPVGLSQPEIVNYETLSAKRARVIFSL